MELKARTRFVEAFKQRADRDDRSDADAYYESLQAGRKPDPTYAAAAARQSARNFDSYTRNRKKRRRRKFN